MRGKAYDTLNRLTSRDRGSLNGTNTGISGTPTEEEDWTLDPLGNWSGYGTKSGGTATLTQTRTHNKANEIAASGISETVGSAWIDPVHDKNGNLTTMPKGDAPTTSLTATYDAWNRMKTAVIGGTTYTYFYDGLGRRSRATTSGGGEATTYYYSGWRLAVDIHDSGEQGRAYVWGLRYIDELVCQEYIDADAPAMVYVAQDANFNVTAVMQAIVAGVGSGVGGRFSYTPYGQRTEYTATWGTPTGPTQMLIGHQGLVHDAATGLIYNRARYLHPGLGRFTGRDPLGYVDGANIYESRRGSPLKHTDASGRSFDTPLGPLMPGEEQLLGRGEELLEDALADSVKFDYEAGYIGGLVEGGEETVAKASIGRMAVRGGYVALIVFLAMEDIKLHYENVAAEGAFENTQGNEHAIGAYWRGNVDRIIDSLFPPGSAGNCNASAVAGCSADLKNAISNIATTLSITGRAKGLGDPATMLRYIVKSSPYLLDDFKDCMKRACECPQQDQSKKM